MGRSKTSIVPAEKSIPKGRRRDAHFTLALPKSHAPRSSGGAACPARATPKVRPIGRAVKLDCLPPLPLWRPRTRPGPTLRLRKTFLFFALPFFFVTTGRFAPLFEIRRLLPQLFLAMTYMNRFSASLRGYDYRAWRSVLKRAAMPYLLASRLNHAGLRWARGPFNFSSSAADPCTSNRVRST